MPLSTATLVSAGLAAAAAGLLELCAPEDLACALRAWLFAAAVDVVVARFPLEEPPSDVSANTSAATPITTPPTITAVTRPGERPRASVLDRRDARELLARRAPLPTAAAPSPDSEDPRDRLAREPDALAATASMPARPRAATGAAARPLPGAGGAGGAGGRRGTPGERAGALGARGLALCGLALFVMFAAAAAVAGAGEGSVGFATPGAAALWGAAVAPVAGWEAGAGAGDGVDTTAAPPEPAPDAGAGRGDSREPSALRGAGSGAFPGVVTPRGAPGPPTP